MADVGKCNDCETWHMGGPCPSHRWGTPEWHRANPIFWVDFKYKPDVLIEDIRSRLAHIRGEISDIGQGYPGWQEQLKSVEGALTCCLIALYEPMTEMKKVIT